MRSLKPVALATVAVILAGPAAGSATTRPWEDLSYPPLSEVEVPEVSRYVLENELILLLLEDREFPLVDIRAYLRAGSVFDPTEKAGLSALTARAVRTGGSEARPGDDLDVYLESIGASIELSSETDRVTITASCLSEHAEEILEILSDLLRRPALPDEKLELAKVDERTSIAARNDEPFTIARREYLKVVYGVDSPYARHTEYATIDAITREDLVSFQQTYYRPDGVVLVMTGDFKAGSMRKKVEQLLGDWANPATPLPAPPPVPEIQPRAIYYAPKTDVTQSTILVGHLGFRRDDPDYPAMRLLNEILGGGMSSRIMNEVRTKRGLAYAAMTIPGYAYPRPGALGALAGTKSESTLVTVRILENELLKVTEEPVTPEELDFARSALLNSFVFNFDSRAKIARRIGLYEFYGYPLDFLQTYQQQLRGISSEDILAAAKRKIHPEMLSVLVIGNQDDFAEPLSELGQVVELDISIPEPPTKLEVPEVTEESRAAALELLASAAELEGGRDKLLSVKTVKTETEVEATVQGMPLTITSTETRLLPDRSHTIQVLPFGEIALVVDGESGWMKGPMGVQDLPPDQLANARLERFRDRFRLLTSYEDLQVQTLESVEENGVALRRVFVDTPEVKDFILFFGEDGRLVGMDYQGRGPEGPAAVSLRHESFTEVDGIGFPARTTVTHDGEPFVTGTVKSIAVNPEVDPAIFERPEG
jgi:zinc protease